MSSLHTLVAPRPMLAMLAEYEASLVELQRAHRQLAAAKGAARGAAEAETLRALERARELGARVRAAQAA